MKFTIKLADPSELQALIQIEELCQEWDNPSWFLEESVLTDKALIAYSADNKPAGYLIIQFLWGNSPFCSLIKVSPEYRKMGLGTELMKAFECRIKQLGYNEYIISTELLNNDTKQFFPKFNFSEIGILDMIHGKEIFYKKTI